MEIFFILVFFGALLIAIVVWNRLESLDRRLSHLEGRIEATGSLPEPEVEITPVRTQTTKPPKPPEQPAQPPPLPPQRIPEYSASPKSEQPPRQPNRTQQEWEQLIGGKLLNRIGALALIFGVGFFLKYAFDNNWISETVRAVIGGVAGLLLLYAGKHYRAKGFAIFAQGIVGAGIAILYLTVYATFNYYHLVPQPVAVVLMSVVTVITFAQAMRYDAKAIAVLGFVGGFLTPFLLSTGECNQVGLFGYIAFLDLGLLAIIVYKRSWDLIELLSLIATAVVYLVWKDECFTSSSLSTTVVFATIFWGLFLASEILGHVRLAGATIRRQVTSILNAAILFCILWSELNHDYHHRMALVSILIAVAYAVTGLSLKRFLQRLSSFRDHYYLVAIVFLVIATAFQFDRFELTIALSLEAVAIVAAGTFWRRSEIWQAALGIFLLVFILLMREPKTFEFVPIGWFTLLLNQRALALVIFAASMLGASILLRRLQEKTTRTVSDVLNVGVCATLFGLATVETQDYFRQHMLLAGEKLVRADGEFTRNLTQVMVWAVYSLPIVWLGLTKRLRTVVVAGLSVAGIAIAAGIIFGYEYRPIEQFVFVFNIRAVTLSALLVVLYLNMRLLATAKGFE